MRVAVDRDLAFIHRFEQGGLGLGGGAVDLVGQQEVAEDGAWLEFESLGVGVVDGDAEDIAGQHIAGELQAMEAAGYRAGKGLGEGGLADAGDILDEKMAARQKAHEREAYDFGLAVNRRSRRPSPVQRASGGYRAEIQPLGPRLIPAETSHVHDTRVPEPHALFGARSAGCGGLKLQKANDKYWVLALENTSGM